jgi:hypothetical protein
LHERDYIGWRKVNLPRTKKSARVSTRCSVLKWKFAGHLPQRKTSSALLNTFAEKTSLPRNDFAWALISKVGTSVPTNWLRGAGVLTPEASGAEAHEERIRSGRAKARPSFKADLPVQAGGPPFGATGLGFLDGRLFQPLEGAGFWLRL